jgi:transcriptional regulator with XRE-family HTH domain
MECFGLLRKLLGIDLTLVAERSGYSRQAISAGESGSVLPRRPMLREWNKALMEIIMERLLEGVEVASGLQEKLGQVAAMETALREQVVRGDRLQAELDALRGTPRSSPPPAPPQEAQGATPTTAA